MVEFSPAYSVGAGDAADDSARFEVRLHSEPQVAKPKRALPPTIPTPPFRRTSPRRVVRTYFVTVLPAPEGTKRGRKPAPEAAPGHEESLGQEPTELEQRIAFRAERAQRYASDRVFPALTNADMLPKWHGDTAAQPGSRLQQPTLVFLRRQRTVEVKDDKEEECQIPWRPSAARTPLKHPAYMSSLPAQTVTKPVAKPVADRRKSVTMKQQDTIVLRETGRKRAEELNEKVLSSVRRNSTQGVSLAEFHDKIRKAGETQRAKNLPPELQDGLDSDSQESPQGQDGRQRFGSEKDSPHFSKGPSKILSFNVE
ncbi:unnamed protein product [Effrenium voratum]|uniref:Uncharacterized protein n=1 Tax=Effrenium voratum TaxID=2562239 RepID=A0AA36J0E4_9DINO|nr:unnamed protein product [Effrenium voratum]